MERTFQPLSAAGVRRDVRLVGFPDFCPRCHTKIVPKILTQVACTSETQLDIEETYQCTNNKCERVFIGTYRNAEDGKYPPAFRLSNLVPLEPRKPAIGDLVAGLSPTFYDVYSQALIAESLSLHQLTGIGLRKALEFLVKDFATHSYADQKADILKKQLAQCIDEYIDDSSVKAMAKRAAWLGNDETHYLRKWGDKDIDDLKVLIRLTVNGIENALLAKKYVTEMPDSKHPSK